MDIVPPSAPTNLTGTATTSGVQLDWTASADNVGVDHYDVFRDGDLAATASDTSFLDSTASVGQHAYTVYAEDAAGNTSHASVAKAVTVPDTEPPSAPTSLTASVTTSGVQLGWTGSTDNVGVDHYDVFRDGTQIGTPSGTSYLDSYASPGDHFYVVYADDAVGNRSAVSGSAIAAARAPTASISAPAAGATYTLGQSVSTTFSCREGTGGPGLSSCDDSTGTKTVDGGSGRLDTSTPGTHNYVVNAISNDGKTGTQSIIYQVTPPPLAVTIKTRRAIANGGQTKFGLACDGGPSGSACEGILSLTLRQRLARHTRHHRIVTFKTIILGRASYIVPSGQRQLVELRLSDSAQRLLRRAARPWIRVEARAKPTAGAGTHRKVILRLHSA
jgi:hypothetical protein